MIKKKCMKFLFGKKKKHYNQGNSFIMVIATLSFLAVLTAAILVAVALSYRLKAYDINSRDNFYVLEQAMDEIYAGVGADSMKHLNQAYGETIEVIVYYDTKTKAYITMENEVANKLMKSTYLQLLKDDENYKSDKIEDHLRGFLSNSGAAGSDAVQLKVGNVVAKDKEISILNLVLKREAEYSTNNTKDKGAKKTFVQSITTDLVIGEPKFNVNFNTISANMDDLYDYTIIADMGVEIVKPSTKVDIVGNIYAASDFYNKDYNIDVNDASNPNFILDKKDENKKINYQKVNGNKNSVLETYNGLNSKSMYSGLYVDGATLSVVAERVVVPGTIAAMNGAKVNVINSANQLSDVWADGIVLGGYSLRTPGEESKVFGSNVTLNANAYVYDDLELNAVGSEFVMKKGGYYGYNYASLDNRTFTDECVTDKNQRSFSKFTPKQIKNENKDGALIKGQDHYNSSAIIVNGNNSSLDLSEVTSMYVAGQSYIEVSKDKKKVQPKAEDGRTDLTVEVTSILDESGIATNVVCDTTTYDTYSYDGMKKDKGKVVDNYTITSDNKGKNSDPTDLQDYRTGEAISIKSNQLAYSAPIPQSWVVEEDDQIYLSLNKNIYENTFFKDYWDDLSKIPVVKSVVSGKKYYFFDFSKVNGEKGMNDFIAEYSNLFIEDEETGMSEGERLGLTDITDYDDFKVAKLNLKTEEVIEDGRKQLYTSSIYTNSAISLLNGKKLTIKASSQNKLPLVAAAGKINESYLEQINAGVSKNSQINTDVEVKKLAQSITSNLQNQYKEVKWMLTSKSYDSEGIEFAHNMSESDISPINYFFDLTTLDDDECEMSGGKKVWLNKGDVHLKPNAKTNSSLSSNNKVLGIVIAKGDVTFDEKVEAFEGIIISGGKVKVNHSIQFTANREVIKSILDECDKAFLSNDNRVKEKYEILKLFRQYDPINKEINEDTDIETESMKKITAVQFEDILSFENWKKNVD